MGAGHGGERTKIRSSDWGRAAALIAPVFGSSSNFGSLRGVKFARCLRLTNREMSHCAVENERWARFRAVI